MSLDCNPLRLLLVMRVTGGHGEADREWLTESNGKRNHA